MRKGKGDEKGMDRSLNEMKKVIKGLSEIEKEIVRKVIGKGILKEKKNEIKLRNGRKKKVMKCMEELNERRKVEEVIVIKRKEEENRKDGEKGGVVKIIESKKEKLKKEVERRVVERKGGVVKKN